MLELRLRLLVFQLLGFQLRVYLLILDIQSAHLLVEFRDVTLDSNPGYQLFHLVHFVVPGDQATVSIPFTLVPREQSVALLENAVLGLLTLCNFLLKPLRPSCNMPSICVLRCSLHDYFMLDGFRLRH